MIGETKQEQAVDLDDAYSHLNNTSPFELTQPTYCKDDSSDDDESTLTESETQSETSFFNNNSSSSKSNTTRQTEAAKECRKEEAALLLPTTATTPTPTLNTDPAIFELDKGLHVFITMKDLTKTHVDVIVNAANERMLGGAGVDAAVHRAAGNLLYQKCLDVRVNLNGTRCAVGNAVLTEGPFMNGIKNVIHTVGPDMRTCNDPQRAHNQLKNCFNNSLICAENSGYKSIAFPAISCGIYRFPYQDAAAIAIRQVIEFNASQNTALSRLKHVVFAFTDEIFYRAWIHAAMDMKLKMKLNQLPVRKSAQSLRVDDDKYGNPGTRHVGDRIEAKCPEWNRHYPGKITKINLDGTYDIAFEDGETRKSVNEDCMIESFDAEEDDEDDSRNCNRNGRTQENPTCSFCRNKEATTKLKNVTNNKWEPTCYDCAQAIEIKVAVQKVRNIKLVSLSPHQVANQALSSHAMKTSRKSRRKKKTIPTTKTIR
jgi:O-acetyl-ADP-ribose deacetylase (regulator of RNase III)